MPYLMEMLGLHLGRSNSQSKYWEVQLCWTGLAVERLRGVSQGAFPGPLRRRSRTSEQDTGT